MFEFDPDKSAANKAKHGIDFSEAHSMRAEEFDRRFDEGVDITTALDLERAHRPGTEQRRVNVDFPAWVVQSLDQEARRLGVTRQSIIKVWIVERLEQGGTSAA